MGMSILNVVYGITPNYDLSEMMSDNEMPEFTPLNTYYSGHSSPMYLGTELDSIDESSQNVDLVKFTEKCKSLVNDQVIESFNEDKKDFLEQLNDLSDELSEEVLTEVKSWLENSVPTICVVWSTT